MRKVKEVLRLRFELGFGQRQIARSCGMGLSTVHEYLERAATAGVEWPLPEGWAKKNWKPSCLGANRSGPKRCSSGRNRTGKRFMSNCNNIAI